MAWYKQRLKAEIQNIIILMEDPNSIKDLIKQTIKINNRIYESKKAKKKLGRLL